MDSSLFLGIDGGQSGTRCLAINGSGEVIGQGEAGKIDFILAPGGKDKLRATLSSVLQKALPNRPWRFRSAFVGLSGVVKGGELEEAVRLVCSQVMETESLEVDTDAHAAWAGALRLQPGIVVIAGSGSVALGVNGRGETARAGGWGFLFGDEGGGFGIARDGLKMVLASIDNNKPLESLIELYTDFFQGTAPEQLAKDFYAGKIRRDSFAKVTPRLATLAMRGDAAAQHLFSSAGHTLATKVEAVSQKLSWPSKEIKWSPVGGVFNSKELILQPMLEYLDKNTNHQFELTLPEFAPVVGAALLAMEPADGPLDPLVMRKIKEQLD